MIRLADEHRRAIHAHAERDYPHECCGALLGRVEGEVRLVAAVREAGNRRETSAATRRFLISPEDYRAIEHAARERSLEIIGFYHSHPDHPARPSEYDREHALPWYSYVIVSVHAGRAGETTSWVLADDRSAFAEEPIAPAPPAPSTQEAR